MRRSTSVSEVAVLERHGPLVARLPRAVHLCDAAFELAANGRPHRLVGRIVATRFEGRWRSGRRSGSWRLDALSAGPRGTLVSVVIEGWRGRGGDDLAFRLARRLRDRVERPLLGREVEPADPPVPTVPVWETAGA